MLRSTDTRRLRLPVLLLLVVAIAACSGKKNRERPDPVEPKDVGPTATELFTKGNQDLNGRDWQAAVSSYDEAIEKDPKQWESHMNRGIALSRMAKFAEALSAFESALRNGGEAEPSVYFNLGNLYQDRGMYSAAIDAYRASLAYEEGQNLDTLVNLGAAYVFLRQWESANATFQHIRQLAPDDPRPLHGMALVKQLNDQYADAVQMYDEVHSMDSSFSLAWFNQARCYAMMKEYADASRAMSEYLRLEPKSKIIGRAKAMKKRWAKKAGEK